MTEETTRLVIRGVRPYDGEYELDTDRAFTTREWHWVKRISGYMPLTVSEGFAGGDPELFVALAVIAMVRAGKVSRDEALAVADQIADAPYDGQTITLVGPKAGDDEIPPVLTSEHDASSQTSSLENNGSNSLKQKDSGSPSPTSSVLSDASPAPTGIGGSGMSVPQLIRTGSVS